MKPNNPLEGRIWKLIQEQGIGWNADKIADALPEYDLTGEDVVTIVSFMRARDETGH